MPLNSNMPASLEALLNDLSFVLPDVKLTDLDVAEIMRLDVHDLQTQFQKDLTLSSFFAMLGVETRHRLSLLENEQQDLENDLAESFCAADPSGKIAATRIKVLVQRTPAWKALRDRITQTSYKLKAVETLTGDLHRKGITLNVLCARGRAELSVGLSHQ